MHICESESKSETGKHMGSRDKKGQLVKVSPDPMIAGFFGHLAGNRAGLIAS